MRSQLDMGITMVTVVLMLVVQQARSCPHQCRCQVNTSHYVTDCTYSELVSIPLDIPNQTTLLNLSYNLLEVLPEAAFESLRSLQILDTRNNKGIKRLPLLPQDNLTQIFTDSGATCCIYDIECEEMGGKEAREKADRVCIETEPYVECDTNLAEILSLIIYGCTLFFSVVFNPWIIVVTIGFRPRRTNAMTLSNAYFSMAYMLQTIYAAVIFGYGIAFYGTYHYNMEWWLDNPGCEVIGYFLITANITTSFLWMVEVICIYLKLRYPLYPDRHLNSKKMTIFAIISATAALFLASIPFMTDGKYNKVGLCLPFYGGDYDDYKGFKYVIMYTVITNATLTVNITLACILLRSFVRDRKKRVEDVPDVIEKETRTFEKMVIIGIIAYILLDIVNVAFLIMSCVGGDVGVKGREWFSRMCVLEALIGPLVGPVRRRTFYRDTVRLLQRWNCYDWDKKRKHPRTVVLRTSSSARSDRPVLRNQTSV